MPLVMTLAFGSERASLAEAPPKAPEEAAEPAKASLTEAFQKGPITISAKVLRKNESLPLFQAPVLRYQDRLAFTFSGEAFDPRVTQADWTLVVVFLPRTVAPTEKGVVSLTLSRTPQGMVAPQVSVPYDSIPMIFLLPDSGGRRKILTDLNAHLADFRNICLKLSDLAEQRAYADRFLKGLESIRQDQSAASYDHAVFNFLKGYGGQVSQDLQAFLSRGSGSNLARFQFLVSEFKRTNLLVPTPDASDRTVKVEGSTLSGDIHAGSLYVAIAFDLMQIFQNLWPGHKFQYVPALARDFDGFKAQLYYDDWIKTTGDVRGALVFSPCRWNDAETPEFQFELGPSECILRPYTQLKLQPSPKSNSPLAIFGHDWHLVLKGPAGVALEPLPLTPNPTQQAFVIEPGPALQKLQQKGLLNVQAHIEGRWGFQTITTNPRACITGLDGTWKPSRTELDHFMEDQACTFALPAPWGRAAAKAQFRPSGSGRPAVPATLKMGPEGGCTIQFSSLQTEAGPGFLEVFVNDQLPAVISVPILLQYPLPAVDGLRAHQGENSLLLSGRNLRSAKTLLLGEQTFLWTRETPEGSLFTAAKGTLEGEPGIPLEGTLKLSDGRTIPVKGASLLPPRPVLQSLEVIPQAPPQGLPLSFDTLLVSTTSPVMVSTISGHKGRYPLGRGPKVLLRNADDPGAAVPLPAAAVRLTGRGQRLLANFKASEALGTRASGRLEIQIQDEGVGASAWTPVPALFLELPTILSLRQEGEGWVAEGALDCLEASASSPAGPWLPLKIGFHEGRQIAPVAPPDGHGILYLKLYGWPDLVVRLQGVPPKAAAKP